MAAFGEGTVWYQRTITVPPKSRGCHYVTDEIIKGMPEIAQIKIGTLNLFMQHTSCSITLNESWDGDVKEDIEMLLNRLIPEKLNYKHSCEGPDDMPAHGKHAILGGANVTVPITDGRMNLGTWQGVWFIEHRNQKFGVLGATRRGASCGCIMIQHFTNPQGRPHAELGLVIKFQMMQ